MTIEPISLWDATSAEVEPVGIGSVSDEADVVIIGGGFTGLSTALHAAKSGLNVQLIEAYGLGHGGSGRNVGLVNAGIWLPPSKTVAALGPVYGREFMQHFAAGPETVFRLINDFQINCEAQRTGTIHVAHSPSSVADLKTRWLDWNAVGAPVDFLDRSEVTAKTGSCKFFAGLVDHRAGTINPMAYCRGLARVALAYGARIAINTPVTGLKKRSDGWQVRVASGAVYAKFVVLATNAYSGSLWPRLTSSYTRIPYFQLATEPLGARIADILPGGLGLWDTGLIMMSLRRDADQRLVIGSMGRLMGTPQRGISRRWAQKQLARLFPDLGPVEFIKGWHGDIAMTSDYLPRIHIPDDGLYIPIGYNGRGITTGTLFGAALADLLVDGDPAKLPLPITKLDSRSIHLMKPVFYRTAFAINQIIKGL